MAFQTAVFHLKQLHPMRIAVMIGFSLAIVSTTGCARTRPAITSLWQQVPPVRWPSRDAHTDSAKPGAASEPAVAANVAIKNDKAADSAGLASTVEGRPKTTAPFGLKLNPPELRNDDLVTTPEFMEPAEPGTATFSEQARSNSPLERLNAALTDDVRHAMTLPQRSVTILEERVRVDSLISRARELFDIGQFDRARDAALAAQELGETAQIEYSPEEDRPIDLVRRIEGQIEATRITQDSPLDDESSAASPPLVPPDSSPLNTNLSEFVDPADRDSKGLTRKQQRSWSTLFRRDKKPGPVAPVEPVTQTSNQVSPWLPAEAPSASPPTHRSTQPDIRDAIVMANRSVSLGVTEPVSESESDFEPTSGRVTSDRESANADIDVIPEPEFTNREMGREALLAITADPSVPPIDADDGTVVLPDAEIVDAATFHRQVASTIDDELQSDVLDEAETCRRSDWTCVYIGMGICSVLAFICYRRGAT